MKREIKIKGIVFRSGNSFGIRVKKALIDSQLLNEGDEVEVTLDLNSAVNESTTEKETQRMGGHLDSVYSPDDFFKQFNISAWTLIQPYAQEPFT